MGNTQHHRKYFGGKKRKFLILGLKNAGKSSKYLTLANIVFIALLQRIIDKQSVE